MNLSHTEKICSKEPYKTLPGDIFVLADAKPEHISDLQRIGRSWTFAAVTKIPEYDSDDNTTSTSFKVKVLKDINVDGGIQKSLFVVFMINTIPNKRIWNALHMYGNLNIIKKVLCTGFLVSKLGMNVEDLILLSLHSSCCNNRILSMGYCVLIILF